jgi:hypothetical protein
MGERMMVAARDLCGCRAEWWKDGWAHVRCSLHTAAPDLLAALEALHDFVRPLSGPEFTLVENARAAIAKAKGEA